MADEHEFSEKELNTILDRLVKGKAPEEIMGQGGLVKDLTRRLVERALEGEMTDHLGYEKHAQEGRNGGNSRNGKTDKRVKSDSAEFGIEVPRDRDGSFDPQMVAAVAHKTSPLERLDLEPLWAGGRVATSPEVGWW